mmetsp:Transcript_4407/g.13826  ORF Transcript_4407/g.13826 Transcript_4407/m.13826 type:complete len:82 (-) Transcript_4407:319-564(-)
MVKVKHDLMIVPKPSLCQGPQFTEKRFALFEAPYLGERASKTEAVFNGVLVRGALRSYPSVINLALEGNRLFIIYRTTVDV